MKKKVQNFFTQPRKILCILLFVVSILFLSITTVYSALYTTMKISGIAHARIETDIRVTDFRLASTTNATSQYEEFTKNTIVTQVELLDTTSSITYYLEITNYGSTDVGIYDITGLPDEVNYTIKDYNLKDKICDSAGKCNSFAVQTYEIVLSTTSSYAGIVQLDLDFRPFYQVIYINIDDYSSYPQDVIEGGNLEITFPTTLYRVYAYIDSKEVDYQKECQNINLSNVTADVTINQKGSLARIIAGNIETVGSEVAIGDEHFYVMKNDGETLTLFAKYNLYVGGYNDSNTWYPYEEEATGRQDSTMLGWVSGTENRNGTTTFANDTYKGTNYSDYEGSLIQTYVNDYKDYLQSLGVNITTARLITVDELDELGCDSTAPTCANALEWVKTSSYWTQTPSSTTNVWLVMYGGGLSNGVYSLYSRGVRPVIELPLDEIDIVGDRNATLVSGDLDTSGSIVQIANEQFYIMTHDEEDVLLLSAYNLYIGGEYVTATSTYTEYGEEATGIQDSTMKGVDDETSIYKGVITFSTTSYWSKSVLSYPEYVYDSNSSLYVHVENYRTYLNNQGVYLKEARLITKEELNSLGCDYDNLTCKKGPSWVYATTYWTGTAQNETYIHSLNSRGDFDQDNYTRYNINGIRPVIKIAIDEIKAST